MKNFMVGIVALAAIGWTGSQAAAASFGVVTLQPGQLRNIDIGPTSRSLRVCNDLSSNGPVVVVIGTNMPHALAPGLCVEDLGDRLMIQSDANGPVTVDFKAICDGADMS